MAGTSDTPLARKLGLEGDVVFTVVGAPEGFSGLLGDVGEAVWQKSLLAPLDAVVGFFTLRSKLTTMWPKLTAPLTPEGGMWVVWPKSTSDVRTDIDEHTLKKQLGKLGWVDDKVCGVDDAWSALRFVLRKELRPGARAGKRPGDKKR
jgi:hypothetical protein